MVCLSFLCLRRFLWWRRGGHTFLTRMKTLFCIILAFANLTASASVVLINPQATSYYLSISTSPTTTYVGLPANSVATYNFPTNVYGASCAMFALSGGSPVEHGITLADNTVYTFQTTTGYLTGSLYPEGGTWADITSWIVEGSGQGCALIAPVVFILFCRRGLTPGLPRSD